MGRQCSLCGGFCRKSGCERESVPDQKELMLRMKSVLQAIKYDYSNSRAYLDDLLALSQITQMEWETRREHITMRIEMINDALGTRSEK